MNGSGLSASSSAAASTTSSQRCTNDRRRAWKSVLLDHRADGYDGAVERPQVRRPVVNSLPGLTKNEFEPGKFANLHAKCVC